MVSLMAMPAVEEKVKEISHKELSQRVAVIKRFKELLKSQRDRLETYLDAMDKQKDVIQTGTTDDLIRHVELEEKIVSDIFSIQKVIDPLEKMYNEATGSENMFLAAKKTKDQGHDGEEVISLKDALEGLKSEAIIRSERNRLLLSKRMAEIRSEIKSLKSSAYVQRRLNNDPAPSFIDMKG